MKPTLIVPISVAQSIIELDYSCVIEVESRDNLKKAIGIAEHSEYCVGIICNFENEDIASVLDLNTSCHVNVFVKCSSEGDVSKLLNAIPKLENRSIDPHWVYFFPLDSPNSVTIFKILSSFGYRSGVLPTSSNNLDEQDFIELATYSFLSPVPHAQIEPFGYILGEVGKKSRYVNVDEYYLYFPGKYLYVSENGMVATSRENLKQEKSICSNVYELKNIDVENIYHAHKAKVFYSHFSNEDECSKCPNMKICSGYFGKQFHDCSNVLSEIYGLIELCQQ